MCPLSPSLNPQDCPSPQPDGASGLGCGLGCLLQLAEPLLPWELKADRAQLSRRQASVAPWSP